MKRHAGDPLLPSLHLFSFCSNFNSCVYVYSAALTLPVPAFALVSSRTLLRSPSRPSSLLNLFSSQTFASHCANQIPGKTLRLTSFPSPHPSLRFCLLYLLDFTCFYFAQGLCLKEGGNGEDDLGRGGGTRRTGCVNWSA